MNDFLKRDRLWSIPAGLVAMILMVCMLPAFAALYVFSAGYSKITGDDI